MTAILDTKAARSLSVYVIMKGKKHVATVRAYHPGSSCRVEVSNLGDVPEGEHRQTGTAGGYGYDKFTAALSGLKVAGHVMTNHCERMGAPRKPRGLPCYPDDAKPRKGYSFANRVEFFRDEKTANKWQQVDTALLHRSGTEGEQYRMRLSRAEALGDYVSGWNDCYRRDGLNYLREIGFTVINAL